MGSETKRTHFCGRAIEHGIGVCQTETCETCPLALPPFATPTPAADGDADGLVSRAIGNIARNYVPENNSGISCGVTPAILSLADRVALVEAGAALRARPLSDDVLAVVGRVRKALDEAKLHGRGTFDAMEPHEAVVAASIADEDLEALLAHIQRTEG